MAFVSLGGLHSGDSSVLAIDTATLRYTNGLEITYQGEAAKNFWQEYQFGLFLKGKALEEQARLQAIAAAVEEEKEEAQTATSDEFTNAMKKHAERVK